MAFVEAPVAFDREPQKAHGIERQVGCADGPGLQRRVDNIRLQAGLGHERAGGRGFNRALL